MCRPLRGSAPFVEVAPRRSALDIDQKKSRYLPVAGRDEVYLFHSPVEGGPGPFREYLLLRDQGRSAVRFVAKDGGARPEDLEIRSYRGDIKTLRPRDLTSKTAVEIDSFLLGQVR